jgi:molybdopterin molybdotransferase
MQMNMSLISVGEARAAIVEHAVRLEAVQADLQEAAGFVLADDVHSDTDIPAFPQSSMDGYAIHHAGWKEHGELLLDGVSAAGPSAPRSLSPGHALRIFTGAAVPEGADTVAMQEKSVVEHGKLRINDPGLNRGDNVRPQGAEMKAGDLALPAGTLLTPAAIGFLAGLGKTGVHVHPAPRVSLIVTGNELQDPGKPLQYGQVYESNSQTLRAALRVVQVHHVTEYRAADDLHSLSDTLRQALAASDLVLLTGGISVGDYDFVLRATQACGVEQVFHKIRQRPGKPISFGKKGQVLVFGLPGNPASVLSCFYAYVCLALEQMNGRPSTLRKVRARIATTYRKPAGLTHFLKGKYDGHTVLPLGAQESFRLSSFALANCLIILEEEVTEVAAGEEVEVLMI